MKNSQRGFMGIVAIIIIVFALIGGSVYIYENKETAIVADNTNGSQAATTTNEETTKNKVELVSNTKVVVNTEKPLVINNSQQVTVSPIEIYVTTDKKEYTPKENVIFKIEMKNISNEEIELEFGGCLTNYTVDYTLDPNGGYGRGCNASMTYITLKPGETYKTEDQHYAEMYNLKTGLRTITVSILSNGYRVDGDDEKLRFAASLKASIQILVK